MNWWRDRSARWGAVLLLLFILVGAGAPFLAPYDPRSQDRTSFYKPPSFPGEDCRLRLWMKDGKGVSHLFGFDGCRCYLLGTDALGRDMLSRALVGARWSMSAAALGVTVTIAFGTFVGAVSGFVGGLWDRFLMRMTELAMALPALYLVLAVRNLFPDDLSPWQASFMIVGSLTAVGWCHVTRLLRGQILALRENEFVASARAVGATGTRVLFRHIVPNALPFVLLQVGITLPYFLLGEAALSYLGLGIPEPEPSWGNMLASAAGNYSVMTRYWWTLWVPGVALTVSVLAANLWVEGLRRTYLGVSVWDRSSPARWGSKQRRHRAS
jgi:peptide/nickel transport system permease protein